MFDYSFTVAYISAKETSILTKEALSRITADRQDALRLLAQTGYGGGVDGKSAGELADNELSALKSAQRRGEEPASEEMNLDTFQRVTREFMGWVISFPQMQGTFCQMQEKERRKWREQVETVRAWAMDTLKALDCLDAAEGGYSIE